METTCWTRGYQLHSKDPTRQVFTSGRDEQDRCKLQIQTQQGRAVGKEGVEDQEDMAPEARPRGEPTTSSDPQENAPLTVARDPGDPRTKEREDHNATHIPFRSWCPICVKAKGRKEAHRNGTEKERGRKATNSFDYKTFGQEDDRDNKATCTKTITPE